MILLASLNLTVLDLFVSTQTITSCGPYTWIDGITYEQSNSTAIFLEFSPDSLCTDTFLLDLTVLPISSSQNIVTSCDTYEWNGQIYNESGEYSYTFQNTQGCDSVATLNLTINSSSTSIIDMSACNDFEWNGQIYSESGVYTYSTSNTQGCDSISTLNLIINNNSSSYQSVVGCDSYLWNDETYTESNFTLSQHLILKDVTQQQF